MRKQNLHSFISETARIIIGKLEFPTASFISKKPFQQRLSAWGPIFYRRQQQQQHQQQQLSLEWKRLNLHLQDKFKLQACQSKAFIQKQKNNFANFFSNSNFFLKQSQKKSEKKSGSDLEPPTISFSIVKGEVGERQNMKDFCNKFVNARRKGAKIQLNFHNAELNAAFAPDVDFFMILEFKLWNRKYWTSLICYS